MKTLSVKSKKWIAAAGLAGLAIIIAVVVALGVGHANGPTRVVKTFFDSFNQRDFDAFVGCYMPKDQQLLQESVEKLGGSDVFFEKNYQTMFGTDAPNGSFGEDVTLSVSDAKATAQTIKDGKFNGIDVESMKVSAVSTVSCTVTTKGSLKEVEESLQVVCFKIEGKWYIYTMASNPTVPESPTDV